MKKLLFFLAGAAAVLSVSAAPQRVNFDKLPKNSQEFVQKHFARQTINRVEMDRSSSWDKYTVYFDNGTELSFEGGSGDWSQISVDKGAVPAGAIPVRIYTYTAQQYSGRQIRQIATTNDGYKVTLSDGRMLDFDKEGVFVKASK